MSATPDTAPGADPERPGPPNPAPALLHRVARLRSLYGPDTGRVFPIEASRVVVGRSRTADLVLHDPEMSRRHFAIEGHPLRGRYAVRDLGSTNGILVDGERVELQPLEGGERIISGNSLLEFSIAEEVHEEDPGALPEALRPAEPPGLRSWRRFRIAAGRAMAALQRGGPPQALALVFVHGLEGLAPEPDDGAGAQVVDALDDLVVDRVASKGHACRLATSEFAVLLSGFDEAAARAWAAGLDGALAQTRWRLGADRLLLRASTGVVEAPASDPALDRLYAATVGSLDEALARDSVRLSRTEVGR